MRTCHLVGLVRRAGRRAQAVHHPLRAPVSQSSIAASLGGRGREEVEHHGEPEPC